MCKKWVGERKKRRTCLRSVHRVDKIENKRFHQIKKADSFKIKNKKEKKRLRFVALPFLLTMFMAIDRAELHPS